MFMRKKTYHFLVPHTHFFCSQNYLEISKTTLAIAS